MYSTYLAPASSAAARSGGRVAVVRAHVVRIDGVDVVRNRAVVAAREPLARQLRRATSARSAISLGVQAMAHQAQRLVVQVAVHVALTRDILGDPLAPPHRPVMLHHQRVGYPEDPATDHRSRRLICPAGLKPAGRSRSAPPGPSHAPARAPARRSAVRRRPPAPRPTPGSAIRGPCSAARCARRGSRRCR